MERSVLCINELDFLFKTYSPLPSNAMISPAAIFYHSEIQTTYCFGQVAGEEAPTAKTSENYMRGSDH